MKCGVVYFVVFLTLIAFSGCGQQDGQGEKRDRPSPVSGTVLESVPTAAPQPTMASTATAIPVTMGNTANCAAPDDSDVIALLRQLQSCKADLSEDASELIDLFIELQEFKTDPEFHQVGFGICCRFNLWSRAVESLADRAGFNTFEEVGIVPGSLVTLGLDYVRSAGQPTEYTDSVEIDLKYAAKNIMGLISPSPIPTADAALGTEIVGQWRDHIFAGSENRVVIINESGQLRKEHIFDDGQKLTDSLIEVQSSKGRRFDNANGLGEYFIIDRQGNLEMWDRYGLVTTARRLK